MAKYSPSLIPGNEDGVCYLCDYHGSTARHEIYYGTGTRSQSQRYGLWVCLCPRCHAVVHADKQGKRAKRLQKVAHDAFIQAGHSEEEFTRRFIKGDVKHWEI